MKHLSDMGKDWDEYIGFSMLSYNCYTSPNLDYHSPYQLVFGHQAKLTPMWEVTPTFPVQGTFKEYQESLQKKLTYLRHKIQKFRSDRTDMFNRDKTFQGFRTGQIVYLFHPRGAQLQTGSRKIKCEFVGPLVIYRTVGPNLFMLMSLDGLVYPHLVEETRLKAGHIRTTKGNVTTLAQLRQALQTNLPVTSQYTVPQDAQVPL